MDQGTELRIYIETFSKEAAEVIVDTFSDIDGITKYQWKSFYKWLKDVEKDHLLLHKKYLEADAPEPTEDQIQEARSRHFKSWQ